MKRLTFRLVSSWFFMTTIAAILLLATPGGASAGEPLVLTDAELDRVSAGSHAGFFPGVDLVHEVNRPSGSQLIVVRLDELDTLQIHTRIVVETEGLSRTRLQNVLQNVGR